MTRNRWLTALLGALSVLHISAQLQATPWQAKPVPSSVAPVSAMRPLGMRTGSLPETSAPRAQNPSQPLEASRSDALEPKPGQCVLPEGAKLPPGMYSNDEPRAGEIVLTFDDGPHPAHTPAVLDALAKYEMPATFFVVGANVTRETYRLIQRMKEDGHDIGSHTYNHDIELASRRWDDGDYVEGQFVLGQIMVELALLAESPESFDELHTEVFGVPSAQRQSVGSIRRHWREYRANHEALLLRLGYESGRRPHDWLLSRPPGGLPYIVSGTRDAAAMAKHQGALARLGWLNILWHGGAGDTDVERRHELPFLLGNLRYHSRRGGIILIHDYIRKDALRAALEHIRDTPTQHVVPLRTLVERKYGCSVEELAQELQGKRDESLARAEHVD